VVQDKPEDCYVGGYADHGALSRFLLASPATLYSGARGPSGCGRER